jgi:hypothetical protein
MAKADLDGLATGRIPSSPMGIAAVVLAMSGCAQLLGADDYTIVVERSDDGGIANAPIAEDRFATEFARVLCEGISPCCDDAGFVFDVGVCKVRLTNRVPSLLGPPHGTSDVYYDAQAAADCVALAGKAAKSCGQGSSTLEATCTSVWKGSRPLGAPCEVAAQCTRTSGDLSNICTPMSLSSGPVCQRWVRGRLGDDCAQTCEETTDGTLRCYSVAAAGPSDAGIRPPPTPSTTTTICLTNDGVFCDGYSGHCEPFSVVPIGMPCGGINVRCELDATCDLSSDADGGGICGTLVPGLNVFLDGGRPCGEPICRARADVGESCEGIGCKSTAYCNDSRVCVEKLANGSLCTWDGIAPPTWEDEECRGVCGGRCASSSLVVSLCSDSPSFSHR